MFQKILLLSFAGALGTLSRYGLSGVAQRVLGDRFPWGTLSVNLIGCLAAGFIWSIVENKINISGQMRVVIFMGFMGAFTTFSTLILETGEFMRDSQWTFAVLNILLQSILGIILFFLGLAAGRFV